MELPDLMVYIYGIHHMVYMLCVYVYIYVCLRLLILFFRTMPPVVRVPSSSDPNNTEYYVYFSL